VVTPRKYSDEALLQQVKDLVDERRRGVFNRRRYVLVHGLTKARKGKQGKPFLDYGSWGELAKAQTGITFKQAVKEGDAGRSKIYRKSQRKPLAYNLKEMSAAQLIEHVESLARPFEKPPKAVHNLTAREKAILEDALQHVRDPTLGRPIYNELVKKHKIPESSLGRILYDLRKLGLLPFSRTRSNQKPATRSEREAELLVEKYRALALSEASKRASRSPSVPRNILEDAAMAGLRSIALRYDETRGVTLAAFAQRRISGAMSDAIQTYFRRQRLLARHAKALASSGGEAVEENRPKPQGVFERMLDLHRKDLLNRDHMYALLLTHHAGLTLAETGRAMGGISEARVSQIRAKARRILRQHLQR